MLPRESRTLDEPAGERVEEAPLLPPWDAQDEDALRTDEPRELPASGEPEADTGGPEAFEPGEVPPGEVRPDDVPGTAEPGDDGDPFIEEEDDEDVGEDDDPTFDGAGLDDEGLDGVRLVPLRKVDRPERAEQAERAAEPLPWTARWLPWLIALPYFIAYTTLSVAKFQTLGMASYDLAIFTQIVRSYSELHAPIAEIKGVDYNALGDHFHPIVATIAPFYAIWQSGITLLVAQALLFALSIVVVSRVAFRRLGTFAGVTIGLAYGLGWGIQSAVSFEFHEVAFAPILMALALQALLDERWRSAMLWSAALLLVKEDLGGTVAMFGVVMFLRGQRLLGAIQAAVGVVGFVLVLKVLIPMFNPEGQYDYTNRDDLGLSFSTFFTDGVHTKIWMLIWLFAITGFLAFRSTIVLLVIPTLVWRFATSNENYWGTSWQYSAILMPVVFMAMIDAMQKMKRSRREWVRGWAAHNPAVTLVVGLMLLQQFPLNQLIKPETYTIPTRAIAARQAASFIPDGAVVESDNGLLPYIVQRTRTLFNGATAGIAPDYVVFDAAWGWAPPPVETVAWAEQQHPPHKYQIVYAADTFTLLKRADYQPPAGWVQPDWREMP